MPLLQLIFILAVIGVLIWVLNRPEVPIDGTYKKLINLVVFVCVILWLLSIFLGGSLNSIRVGSP